MRTPSQYCQSGRHRMTGANLIWHTRYDEDGKKLVRECRACANARYRVKRSALRRNRELEQEALTILEKTA